MPRGPGATARRSASGRRAGSVTAAASLGNDGSPDLTAENPTGGENRRGQRVENHRSAPTSQAKGGHTPVPAPTGSCSWPGHTPPAEALLAPAADTPDSTARDDSLALLLLCCHPALTRPSQVALTLRAVAGLSTAQIARAFLVPEATMAQRISRAKTRLRQVGARFTLPAAEQLPDRVAAVAQVLYLIFTEGHTATTGTGLSEVSLADEAIRLTRQLHRHLPAVGEVTGLLALLLLTDARRAARTRPDGSLVPLASQDRSLWDRERIAEGVRLIEAALPTGPVGPYQLQAAIAAVHAEAPRAADTDWAQIETLYRMLGAIAPGPMVELNHAVAVAMVDGPAAGLAMLEPLLGDRQLRRHHRLHAVHAHLLEMDGREGEARAAYATAARLATSIPEQRYLNDKAARGEERHG
jgi:predicted RNA polymerase sigma factor